MIIAFARARVQLYLGAAPQFDIVPCRLLPLMFQMFLTIFSFEFICKVCATLSTTLYVTFRLWRTNTNALSCSPKHDRAHMSTHDDVFMQVRLSTS